MLHADRSAGCWIWTGAKDRRGYGKINVSGKYVQTHRAAWNEFFGDAGGAYVCHRCDTPSCFNPDHLFLGSQRDNIDDMLAKGRQAKGDMLPGSKLTPDIVQKIRLDGASCRKAAAAYNISAMAVWKLRNGKTWKHTKETP